MVREIIKPAAILCLICAIITAALAYVYGVTHPIITAREAADKQALLAEVLSGVDSFAEAEAAEKLSASGLSVPDSVSALYRATAGGSPSGCVVEVAPRGYGGAITMLIGIRADGTVAKVAISSMNETPGLGTKAKDAAFLAQFEGIGVGAVPTVVKTGKKNAGEVDAISGATVTSKAVARGVADALTLYGEVK